MRKCLLTAFFVSLLCSTLLADSVLAFPFFHKDDKEMRVPPVAGPLTFKDCYMLALKQSEEIAIKREAIEATEADIFQAASEALGDVRLKMTQFRQDVRDGGDSSGVAGTLSAQLKRERRFEISQPLFQGFKAFAALNAAGALRKQRTQERIRAEQLLFFDVANAFYSLLRYKKDVEIMDEIEKLFKERIEELRTREAIGRSRRSEAVTAESRLKTLYADLARSKGDRALARYLVEFLTGISIEDEMLLDEDLPLKDSENLDNYLARSEKRPDVEAANQAYRITNQGVISAQSDLWPSITLDTKAYEKREGFQSGIDWDVLFTVDVPLFQGGEIVGNIKEALSTKRKYELTRDLTKREAELDIKESFQNWLTSIERYRALDEAAASSEENYKLQKEEYERNLVSNLDVLEALASLNQTRRDVNQALYEMKEDYWGLKVAVGDVP